MNQDQQKFTIGQLDSFLKKNDFKQLDGVTYINKKCKVVIGKRGYIVTSGENYVSSSSDYNLYWLIGVLTYLEYINRNYVS